MDSEPNFRGPLTSGASEEKIREQARFDCGQGLLYDLEVGISQGVAVTRARMQRWGPR